MFDKEDFISLISVRLSDYRYHHSVCVAERAAQLAQKYSLDTEKAYITGILHDITKEDPLDYQRKIIETDGCYTMTPLELAEKNIYHQISGAAFAHDILGITDPDILGGIRYHTTGRADMTTFEMIIYLADFTSEDRSYPDVDIMRAKTDASLFDGMLYSLSYTIRKLASDNKPIHPDTLHCYNWVLSQINK